jgi:hypothetical protein
MADVASSFKPISSKCDRSDESAPSPPSDEWKEDDLLDLELLSSGGDSGVDAKVIMS